MKRTENYKEYIKTTIKCETEGCEKRVKGDYKICYNCNMKNKE